LAKKRRARSAKLKRVDAELNAAVHAAASPDQLITLSRQGPGLEKITVRMKHKDLGGAGLVLQKFVSSIDGVGYRAGKPIIKFYVTVKPGLYEEFNSEMHSLSQGTATISLATEHEKKVHFSGSTTGHGAISNSVEQLVSLVRHSNGSRNTIGNNNVWVHWKKVVKKKRKKINKKFNTEPNKKSTNLFEFYGTNCFRWTRLACVMLDQNQ
jgi:hypothetical protein